MALEKETQAGCLASKCPFTCCRVPVRLHTLDIVRFTQHFGDQLSIVGKEPMSEIHVNGKKIGEININSDGRIAGFLVPEYKLNDKSCPLLSEKKLCTIHDSTVNGARVKPFRCRLFPKHISKEEGKQVFKISNSARCAVLSNAQDVKIKNPDAEDKKLLDDYEEDKRLTKALQPHFKKAAESGKKDLLPALLLHFSRQIAKGRSIEQALKETERVVSERDWKILEKK